MLSIEKLTALELISRLPDDTPLTVEEAAIFCRRSVSTMNKMRLPNYPVKGPRFSQGGREGCRGSNQGIVYFKRDLVDWLKANLVSDTHEAAVRKGQMFATLFDVAEEKAFWRTPGGKLAGLVERTDADIFFARLFDWTIEWWPALDAVEQEWEGSAISDLKSMGQEIDDVLSQARDRLRNDVERAEIEAELPPRTPGPRPVRRDP